jgi:hypothetical protein
MTRRIIIILATLLALCACTKRTPELVRLARAQMPATIDSTLIYEYGAVKDIQIDSFALVYHDDSICMLQCRVRCRTLSDESVEKEYRYYYLFDILQSNLNNRMIFSDGLTELPLLPKERIESSLKEVGDNHESVYDKMYVRTKPIRHPVGNKYMSQ